MRQTDYFIRTRSQKGHVSFETTMIALANEVERVEDRRGRIRVYGWVPALEAYVRVILVDGGRALLNAFIDTAYTKKRGTL